MLAWRRLPTYGPGGDWQCGGGGRQRGGGELLGPELVVADEAVGRQAEVRQELDQELVPLREHGPARVPPGKSERHLQVCLNMELKKKQKTKNECQSQGDLLRWAVSAVLPNPLGVVDFGPVEDGDVVVAAVVVSLHVKLLKLDFDDLQQEAHRKEREASVSEAGAPDLAVG